MMREGRYASEEGMAVLRLGAERTQELKCKAVKGLH